MKSIIAKIKEFIGAEKQKLEGKTSQEKLEYFWEYYKFAAITIVAIVASIIYTVVAISSEKNIVLSGYMLESYADTEQTAVFEGFNDYAQINTEEDQADFLTNMSISSQMGETASAVQQRLLATVAAGETDFIAAPTDAFSSLAYQETAYFIDLREYFTDEQLEQLGERVYYVDAAYQQELWQTYDLTAGTVSYPDPHSPETMEDPIPIGIDIAGNPEVDVLYVYMEEHVYLGIVGTTPHPEMTLQFIQYLLS